MAAVRERAKLASAAERLNRRAAVHLPPLFLVTDDVRVPDPVAVAKTLPQGSGIILRHRDAQKRSVLAEALATLVPERALFLMVAGDEELARAVGADGVHFAEAEMGAVAACRWHHPLWCITVAAHSGPALRLAAQAGADAAFFAPLFPTRSHPEKSGFGLTRFRFLAARAPLPVYALGGVTAQNAARLDGAHIAGIAAIEGLMPG